ncbi:MAG: LytTR family transcriptional regulator DNA-binding domain-containing protein [Novosphingobium sp.]|nr:LytTR family transcriptional regulator DNA-binding domain-containing protein [Novosphingobium sp.]
MCGFALVVAMLGPFGTYTQSTFGVRLVGWTLLLLAAYVLIRPAVVALRKLAYLTGLPATAVTVSGVMLLSAPLTMVWRMIGKNEFSAVEGYLGLMPFSVFCALAVLAVATWSRDANRRLDASQDDKESATLPVAMQETEPEHDVSIQPALLMRLSQDFRSPILALESEDHYVRVHGEHGSELVLVRLRDAIAEMDGVPGEQVHRSWWIAKAGIANFEPAGRSWKIYLSNGIDVTVARDSVPRLQQSGFLPA